VIEFLLYMLAADVLFIAICMYRDHKRRVSWTRELRKSHDNYVNRR